ncbi:tRNA pseudouridine(38/39) synthase [Cryptotermes secundus]|uniref:tRNA pseudouridine(38/39) synthase n=1 Tax=Cryptotermes secundus TaxID=105785 RepID=A0A2J7PY35_9NEOP|nr:tRNA pseudouridine(38/39) synthase isoform X3 [Cryptotermes secundus]PNF21236.1 tRNA pseudouridine(38/39) synthase [Cryptotermes secundus]
MYGITSEELINHIQQLEAHNNQLKNIINKSVAEECTRNNLSGKKDRKFNFSKCSKRHVMLKLLYLGWEYQGYTTQEDTTNTIEHNLFTALVRCCLVESRQTSNYSRCGRTDKGVSSFCQVVSLDIRSRLTPEQLSGGGNTIEEELDYSKLLNRVLPPDIRVLAWCPAPPDFSARFDCKERTYKYFFPRGNLNIEAMDAAVRYAVGCHDFRNLCKMDVANGVCKYDRRILSAEVKVLAMDPFDNNADTASAYDMCELTLVGQAYLWHQVRCIMGILLLIGQGKEKIEVMKQLLDIESHPMKPQYCLASHVPLNLFHCEFECSDWVISKEVLIGVIRHLQQEWTMYNVKSTMIRSMLLECQGMLSDGGDIQEQSSCLLQGIQAKGYQPLFQRPTCSSLENRIEHFVKKHRLEIACSDDRSN